MDQEEYFERFFQYMECSEDNQSIFPNTIRPKVDQIYAMYKGREPSEDEIKRDAHVFLLGMEARVRQDSEIAYMRKSTHTLSRLVRRIGSGSQEREHRKPSYGRVSVNPGQE